ncbi:MAG: HAMP domain-containing protein, partial [Burkholderiales bacterium]|nr:HAMP domain-containing protein [Opitutaceae bacterium]
VAALFGGASLLIVVAAGLFAYNLIVDAKLDFFRKRLESLALSLSQTIEADAIPGLSRRADDGVAWRAEWHGRLMAIVEREPDIDSIYILLKTNQPAQLKFLLDASKASRIAEPGEIYDASELPYMLRAFTRVQVEDRVYEDEFGSTQSAYAPLRTTKGEVVGIVGVDVLAVRIEETRNKVLLFCVALFGVTAGALVLVAYMVRRRVSRPIARVLTATEAITAGRYDMPAGIGGDDEFGVLGRRIDEMAKQLGERERLRTTFGLYVSHGLAQTLLQSEHPPQLGGSECLATVVFCDLANYSRLGECFSPAEIVSLANEYLGAMASIIEGNGGCVLDFNGDGIMAVFGAPVAHADHPGRALRSAIEMQQRMNQLNGEWEARGLAVRWQKAGMEQIILRVGLHTGPVVAGNLGCATRMKYCVMGDTVSVAARLEEMNKELGTRIAMSEDVRQRAGEALSQGFVDCDLRAIRGRNLLVHVFAL